MCRYLTQSVISGSFVYFLLIVFCKTTSSTMEKVSSNKDLGFMSESQNTFTKRLYLALCESTSGNLFFSPFSIRAAMAMVHMGAKHDTESQIRNVLHFPQDKTLIMEEFKKLIPELIQANDDYELRTSNSAYISNKMTVLEEFSAILTDYFHSRSKLVDFGEVELVRQEINSNVEKETNSLIKDLIPPGALDPDLTRMVLVNAIYFKGLWEHPFAPSHTQDAPFWITKDSSVLVPMMSYQKSERYGILDDLNATMIALNYKGNRMHMAIILPDKRDGLKSLEEKLDSVKLSELEDRLTLGKVLVALPKFKLEESFKVVQTFQKLGLLDLFSPSRCDLSGINGGEEDLFVSDIFHKAFVDVNEEGTEAAAATGVVMMARSMVVAPRFFADHPFIFYIRDRPSGQILFAGRFTTPPSKAPLHVKDDL